MQRTATSRASSRHGHRMHTNKPNRCNKILKKKCNSSTHQLSRRFNASSTSQNITINNNNNKSIQPGLSSTTHTADIDRYSQALAYPLSHVTVLGNGLRVITEAHDSPLTTIGVIIDAGSRYEQPQNNGTAHFLEHMFFKGTGNRTRHQLELEIEQIGGSFNAHTTREQTTFTMTVMKQHVEHVIELFSDIILNSTFQPKSIENERFVIIEESETVSMDTQEVLFDKLHEVTFPDSSLGYTILGSTENIQKISQQDIRQYIKTHYVGPRMMVSVVGDINHDHIVRQVKHHFASVPSLPHNGINADPGIAKFVPSEYRLRDDNIPKAHIAIGFETAGWNDPDHFSLMVLQCLLGSYHINQPIDTTNLSPYTSKQSSLHLADSITPFNTVYKDNGIFGLVAIADGDNVEAISKDLPHALNFFNSNINEKQLNEAKSKLAHNFLSQYEGTEAITQELARQFLAHGRRLHPYEVLKRLDNIDVTAVQNASKRFFHKKDFTIAALGPIFKLPHYAALRKKNPFSWF